MYHTEHRPQKEKLFQEMRKKLTDKHVKGKVYKTISKQLDVPVNTVAYIIPKCKANRAVIKLPRRGSKRKTDNK